MLTLSDSEQLKVKEAIINIMSLIWQETWDGNWNLDEPLNKLEDYKYLQSVGLIDKENKDDVENS